MEGRKEHYRGTQARGERVASKRSNEVELYIPCGMMLPLQLLHTLLLRKHRL